MPHIPDSRHADHDLLLVAAYAAGDASGPALDDAIATVAVCTECAALHHDLRAISAVLPTLPPATRPRDFRLSPEQAASLRPAGWRRLLAPFAGPRFAFAGPLGTGLATLGIAGLLVAGSVGAPVAPAAPQDGGGQVTASGVDASEAPAPGGPAVPAAEFMTSPAPDGDPGGVRMTGADPSLEPAAGDETAEVFQAAATPELFQAAATPEPAPAFAWLPAAAVLLLVAGLLVGGLRLLARRAA